MRDDRGVCPRAHATSHDELVPTRSRRAVLPQVRAVVAKYCRTRPAGPDSKGLYCPEPASSRNHEPSRSCGQDAATRLRAPLLVVLVLAVDGLSTSALIHPDPWWVECLCTHPPGTVVLRRSWRRKTAQANTGEACP